MGNREKKVGTGHWEGGGDGAFDAAILRSEWSNHLTLTNSG